MESKGEAEFNSGFADSNKFIFGRDEFGFPIFNSKQDVNGSEGKDDKVFEILTEGAAGDGGKTGARDGVRVGEGVSGVKYYKGKAKELVKENVEELGTNLRVNGVRTAKNEDANNDEHKTLKSWSQVVKNSPSKSKNLSFDYLPFPRG